MLQVFRSQPIKVITLRGTISIVIVPFQWARNQNIPFVTLVTTETRKTMIGLSYIPIVHYLWVPVQHSRWSWKVWNHCCYYKTNHLNICKIDMILCNEYGSIKTKQKYILALSSILGSGAPSLLCLGLISAIL